MKVIAINEQSNDFPVAVIMIPEGRTADETFCQWYRQKHDVDDKTTDAQILEEALFAYSELLVQEVF